MKTLFSEMQKQRVIIFSFLTTFLFSGIGVGQGIPIFLTAIAHAHPVFISENNHKIRLILHHPGNHDEHEVSATHQHHHDLLDRVIAASKKGNFSHTDHEIEIPSFKEKNATTNKSQTLLTASKITPISLKHDVSHPLLGHASQIIVPPPPFPRTTILII